MNYNTDREKVERYGEDKYFNLFVDKMTEFFKGAPPAHKGVYDGEVFPFKNGLHEYLMGIYPLFNIIINLNLPESIPDKSREDIDYEKAAKFLKAIYFRKLQQGRKINRYTAGWQLSSFIKKLVKIYNGDYYLLNNDRNSEEFKLALLSVIDFEGDGQETQFAKKLAYWDKTTI